MFAKAKQEKRGSLIGFATGMDPNYKTSKKILIEMSKHCGAVEVGMTQVGEPLIPANFDKQCQHVAGKRDTDETQHGSERDQRQLRCLSHGCDKHVPAHVYP